MSATCVLWYVRPSLELKERQKASGRASAIKVRTSGARRRCGPTPQPPGQAGPECQNRKDILNAPHHGLARCHRQGGGKGIEVRNFPQFSAISQFPAIFLLCPSYVLAGDPCCQCCHA